MTTDNFDAATSRDVYLPQGSNNLARLWTTEKAIQTLAAVGMVDLFEGGGSDPTGLSGYATTKLWLHVEAGVTSSAGTVRYYAGGSETDIASWPALTRAGFLNHLSASGISINSDNSTNNSNVAGASVTDALNTILANFSSYVPTSDKGAANGIATLDGSGTLTPSQIPSSLVGAFQYQGTWNASTNTPTLADGVGTTGHVYKVSTAGTTNLDGYASWDVGDELYFDGTVWEVIKGGGAIASAITPAAIDTRIILHGTTNRGGAKYQVAWTADGRLLAWGDVAAFAFNPVGDREYAYEIPVPFDTDAVSVEAIYCGQNYILIQTDEATGNLYHMGSSDHGQGGHGATTAVTEVTVISALSSVHIEEVTTESAMSTTGRFWFARTSAGEIWSCGYSGAQYVMGHNDTANRQLPRRMTYSDGSTVITDVAKVYCDQADAPVWALLTTGAAIRWGAGTDGAHGNNSTSAMPWPEALETSPGSGTDRTDIAGIAVAGANNSVTHAATWLLTTAGKIECAGAHDYGIGDGAALGATDAKTFQAIAGALNSLITSSIYAGGGSTPICIAITSTGRGYICGRASSGLVGNGSTSDVHTFRILSGLPANFSDNLTGAIIAGGYDGTDRHSIYLEATIDSAKQIASIGYDSYYATGKNTSGTAAADQTWGLVQGTRGVISSYYVFGDVDEYGLAVLNADNELRYCGRNDQGQSGFGGTSDIPILQPVRTGMPRLLKVPTHRGDYSDVVEYSYNDEVTDAGSSWRYVASSPSTGNRPPVLPTESNTYWQLAARVGGDLTQAASDYLVDIEQERQDAQAARAGAEAAQTAAAASRVGADEAKTAAEAARDAAFANADVYADEPTGRAAVADGEQYMVEAGAEIIRYERVDASSSTEVARYPTVASISGNAHSIFMRDNSSSGRLSASKISELEPSSKFGSGSKLLVEDNSGSLRKIDFDDISGNSSLTTELLDSYSDGFAIDIGITQAGRRLLSKADYNLTFNSVDDIISVDLVEPVRIINASGVREWNPHNFYHDSGNPAFQNRTIKNGVEYTVSMTGPGSLSLTDATTATVTEGAPHTFTASSTLLTTSIVGSVTTMQLNYGSTATEYIESPSGAVRVAVPISRDPLGAMAILVEPSRTNYLLNSTVPVTQTVSLDADDYVLWVEGSGSVALSGGPTGTATEGSPVTFTLGSTTSVTFTKTGSIDIFQCENGTIPTSHIVTYASPVTRSLPNVNFAISSVPALTNNWLTYSDFVAEDVTSSDQWLFNMHNDTGLANYLGAKVEGSSIINWLTTASTTELNKPLNFSATADARIEHSFSIEDNSFVASVNGIPPSNLGVAKDFSIFNPTKVTLGHRFNSYFKAPLHIRRFALVPWGSNNVDEVPSFAYVHATNDRAYDIFVLAGQSNVYSGATLDAGLDGSGGRVWQLEQDGSLSAADEPLDHPVPATGQIGFGVHFAKSYYIPNQPNPRNDVMLLPCAIGNTGFSDNKWGVDEDLFSMTVAMMRVAIEKYPNARLRGLLWMQGERDALAGWTQVQYETAFDAMINQMRSRFGEFPVIVGGMRPAWVGNDANRQPVEDALANTPNRLYWAGYADPNTSPVIGSATPSEVHYSAAEQRLFAERFWSAWQSL